jgi:signal transduction histidine kinase
MTLAHRLTLGQKFLATFTILICVLGLSLAAILFYLSQINGYIERAQRITLPSLSVAAAMRHHLYQMSMRAHNLFEQGVKDPLATIGELRERQAELGAMLQEYRDKRRARIFPVTFSMLAKHGRADLTDLEDQALDEIAAHLQELETNWEDMLLQLGRKADREARRTLERADGLTKRLIDATTTLIKIHTQINAEMKLEGDSLLFQTQLIILGLVLSLGLLIIAAYVGLNKQVARPLRRLAGTAGQVAHHELTTDFERWESRDEVGQLSRSLQTMLENIRERTQALEQKTRSLESFTYSVAHDLKTPLREIEGFSSLLERKVAQTADDKVRHYVSVIHTCSLRMTALIEDLLRYSRLELQAQPCSRFNVRDLAHEVVEQCLAAMAGGRPEVTVDLPFTTMTGAPTSIRQVLANLVDNAIKYSRNSTPSRIVVGGEETEKEQIIWVRDNGIGIAPEQTARIFGLFERLHNPDEYEGTGVGLAIVKLVMDKHQGRVRVESTPGSGSTFYLVFPHSEGS